MGFIAGLKELFKTPLYAVIIISFLIAWFLGLFGSLFIPDQIEYNRIIIVYFIILIGFNIVLFVFSFFKPVDELGKWSILIALLLSFPTLFLFSGMIVLFLGFCIIANQFFTAFFAFRACIDTSTKCDDFFYNKRDSRKVTRIIEFVIFGVIDLLLMSYTSRVLLAINPEIAFALSIIFWSNVVLMSFVILRFIFTSKFAAYITLFFLLSFFYILYLFVDIAMEIYDPDTAAIYEWYWFLIDLFLFLYIMGSIFDKVDYLEDKIPLIRASTIAVFVIIMKLMAQAAEIIPNVPDIVQPTELAISKELSLFVIFLLCTFWFGLYSIFKHKEGKTPDV